MQSLVDSFVLIIAQSTEAFAAYLPRILASLVVLLIGTAIAKVIRRLIIRLFESIRLSQVVKNTPIEHFLNNAEVSSKVEDVVGAIFYWLMMLVVLQSSVSILGLTSLSVILERVLSYVPHIISAVIILVIGVLLAGLAEGLVKGTIKTIDGKSARLLGKLTSYSIMVLTTMIAISELGIAKEYILIMFIGFVTLLVLGLGLALGLGGQHIVRSVLEVWYKKVRQDIKE